MEARFRAESIRAFNRNESAFSIGTQARIRAEFAEVYNLPESPKKPTTGMKARYLFSFAAGAALTALAALFFAQEQA
jgi:hypothetical protein